MTLPVSIIIPKYTPTFQHQEWYEECVESALLQDCEVVVLDDASPIGAAEMFDKRIVYGEFKENKGVSAARNAAIRLATQPFIFPLDCDDILKPGSIKKLLDAWTGVPIYSDLEKFGDVTVEHFVMLDFSCEALLKYVGPYPVSVLHTKTQWESVGGYNEKIDFYEDGEYNAKLMLKYCGQRYPEPLLRYRFHANQRTKKYNNVAGKYIEKILPTIKEYSKMPGCCGGRNKTQFGQMFNTKSPASDKSIVTSDASIKVAFEAGELALPLEADGKVLARYIGGRGKGKHVYKGNISNQAHARITYGALLYADPRDVKDPDTGLNGGSMLIKVKIQSTPIILQSKAMERQPMQLEMSREPLETEAFEEEPEYEDYDIAEHSIKKIKKDIVTAEDATVFLPIEQQGKNRTGVIEYLQGLIERGQ